MTNEKRFAYGLALLVFLIITWFFYHEVWSLKKTEATSKLYKAKGKRLEAKRKKIKAYTQ